MISPSPADRTAETRALTDEDLKRIRENNAYHAAKGHTDLMKANVEYLLANLAAVNSRVEELQAQLDKVHAFVNERAQFIQVLRNYVGEDNGDYIRWTGHAEARRVLAETLGIELDKDAGGIRKPAGGPSNGS